MHPSGDFEGFSPQSRPPDFRDKILAQADDAVARIEARAATEPELDEYGIPAREKRPRFWPARVLSALCVLAGLVAFVVAVRAETSAHGVRWHTHHWGIESPGWGTIAASIGLAIWKGRQGEKSRFWWWILGIAFALGVLAIWALSLVQPYQDVGS